MLCMSYSIAKWRRQSTASTGHNNTVYLCLWAEFLPKVPGLCLLARCVPPLHVSDGESAQDSTLQLHQWSPGLCRSSSRTHTTGTTVMAWKLSYCERTTVGQLTTEPAALDTTFVVLRADYQLIGIICLINWSMKCQKIVETAFLNFLNSIYIIKMVCFMWTTVKIHKVIQLNMTTT